MKNSIYGYFIALLTVSFNVQAMLNNEITESNNNSWHFIAYLDDMEIGHHDFEVSISGIETTVLTRAEFDVSFMFIPIFKYEHSNQEVWNNGCLIKLNSSTFNDGEELFVKLFNDNGITHIETANGNLKKSDCVRSFAYWDVELIKSKVLLNSQSGELIDITYRLIGEETLLINNQPVDTQRYQLLGKDELGIDIDISLWYNNSNRWVALESKLENGRVLRYQLKQEM